MLQTDGNEMFLQGKGKKGGERRGGDGRVYKAVVETGKIGGWGNLEYGYPRLRGV